MLHIKLKVVANKLPLGHHPGVRLKGQNSILSEHGQVPYQIKGNDEATWKDIFCPYSHPPLLRWGQNVKIFFSESSHGAYQINFILN